MRVEYPARYMNFNPRSREGSDFSAIFGRGRTGRFQSTLPRGERPGILPENTISWHFNPRSREGSDDRG